MIYGMCVQLLDMLINLDETFFVNCLGFRMNNIYNWILTNYISKYHYWS